MTLPETPFFSPSKKIKLFPLIHGSGDFSRLIRQELLSGHYDCLALPLPPSFKKALEQGTRRLPLISAVCLEEEETGDLACCSFIPVDPCQPLICALRIAIQERIPRSYLDLEVRSFKVCRAPFPDPYALKTLSMEKFTAALLPYLPRPREGSQQDRRIRRMAFQLHALEMDFHRILFPCSLHDWVWIREAYNMRSDYPGHEIPYGRARLFPIRENSLYFVTGELPFVTYLYEKRREELLSDASLSIDGVKELLIATRKAWERKRRLAHQRLSPQMLQVFLQYIRNLALMEHRMTPDLYTLVMAAKQICGDEFAIALVETAKKYPYQQEHLDPGEETALIGVGKGKLPHSGVAIMKNRLAGPVTAWRSIPLKPPPPELKKKHWKMLWNPLGCCSWPPEDQKIESFNTHIREQARAQMGEDLALTEKFTSSIKDGIDIRETLRKWHTGDLYVKNIPPNRGSIEVVVIIFESGSDPAKYTWRETWFAEHAEESTLCFYATPYREDMAGPGISRSVYGGFFLLYPPRFIPNIWKDPRFQFTQTLEERLIAGACRYSREKNVVVVTPGPLRQRWRGVAGKYKRHLIPIPLKRFSMSTLERVRNFHVLNGKKVRSYAADFIRDF